MVSQEVPAMPFLEKLAIQFNRLPERESTIVVLPTKRAARYFLNFLSATSNHPFILPEVITPEVLMQRISRFRKLSLLEILPQAYLIQNNIPQEEKLSFIQFMEKTLPMLEDFNEMDRNLVNPAKAFENLKALYDLRRWDPSNNILPSQEDEVIPYMRELYFSLYQELSKNKTGYQGLVYREAAKEVNKFLQQNSQFYLFGGFSWLSRSESLVFDSILTHNKGKIYWDLPKTNEYDRQIFPYQKEWTYYQSRNFTGDCLGESPLDIDKIQLITVEGNATLAKHIPEAIRDLPGKTGVILANQQLLPAILNSWEDSSELNVSTGIPAFQYPVSVFIDSLMQFRLNHPLPVQEIPVKEIVEFLSSPFITNLFPKVPELLNEIRQKYGKYINPDEINKELAGIKELARIVQRIFLEKNIIRLLLESIDLLFPIPERGIQTEILYHYHQSLSNISILTNKYSFLNEQEPLVKYIRQMMAQHRIQLKGSPEARYQIIGFQEAQLIPFDNIIIAPVNEGVIPRNRHQTGYIPPDLKRNLGIPNKRIQVALDTYHYHQLFRQSSYTICIFNSHSDTPEGGEPARYIQHLLWKHPDKKIQSVSPALISAPNQRLIIPSTDSIRKKILSKFEKGISASMIISYLYNPVNFYYRYILEVPEPDTGEALPASTMGTILHRCLEDLYRPFINKDMETEYYKVMHNKLDQTISEQYHQVTRNRVPKGAEIIAVKVIKRYIEKFLQKEQNLIEKGNSLRVLSLEKEYQIPWYSSVLDKTFHLRGNIDRIDIFNGAMRIIDYKTGFVKTNDVIIPEMSYAELFNEKKHKALQLFFYLLLYCLKESHCNDIQAGIVSFRNLKTGFMPLSIRDRKEKRILFTKKDIEVFDKLLSEFIVSFMDPTHSFIEVIRDEYGNPI